MSESWASPAKPWTGSQIRRLGKAVIAGGEAMEGLSYQDVTEWYGLIAERLVERVDDMDYGRLGIRRRSLSYRVKTIGTLRDKLTRRHGLQIDHVHDIIGLRIVADMTLPVQTLLAKRIGDVLPVKEILDLRSHPHSGYRAVHVIIRLDNGVFAELQTRTLLQDAWANCFEEAGDLLGREIRYGGRPTRDDHGVVDGLLSLSDEIRRLEESMTPDGREDVMRRISDFDTILADIRNNGNHKDRNGGV